MERKLQHSLRTFLPLRVLLQALVWRKRSLLTLDPVVNGPTWSLTERKDSRKLKAGTVRGILNTTAAVERRTAIRFRFDAPVIVEWMEPSGAIRRDIGRTRDISIFGAFVIYHSPLPAETVISLEVHLPPLERDTDQLLQFTGRGRVTRASKVGKDGGFAACVQFILKENTFAGFEPVKEPASPCTNKNSEYSGSTD